MTQVRDSSTPTNRLDLSGADAQAALFFAAQATAILLRFDVLLSVVPALFVVLFGLREARRADGPHLTSSTHRGAPNSVRYEHTFGMVGSMTA